MELNIYFKNNCFEAKTSGYTYNEYGFIGTIIRNSVILVGIINMNMYIQRKWPIAKNYTKEIASKASHDINSSDVRMIASLHRVEDDFEFEHDNNIILCDNMINPTHIDAYFVSCGENELIELMALISRRRIYQLSSLPLNRVVVAIDGLTYMPNLVTILKLAAKNPFIQFRIKMNNKYYLGKKLPITKEFVNKRQQFLIDSSNIYDNILFVDNIEVDNQQVFMVETGEAMEYTSLSDHIDTNFPNDVMFVFGSEGDGISENMLTKLNAYHNKQNIVISSQSQIVKSGRQQYSLNVAVTIISVLSIFDTFQFDTSQLCL